MLCGTHSVCGTHSISDGRFALCGTSGASPSTCRTAFVYAKTGGELCGPAFGVLCGDALIGLFIFVGMACILEEAVLLGCARACGTQMVIVADSPDLSILYGAFWTTTEKR